MKANNSSGFNCRKVVGNPYRQSPHSYGIAIDVNPVQNPYRDVKGKWWPSNGKSYIDRTPRRFGMLTKKSHLTKVAARRRLLLGWVLEAGTGLPALRTIGRDPRRAAAVPRRTGEPVLCCGSAVWRRRVLRPAAAADPHRHGQHRAVRLGSPSPTAAPSPTVPVEPTSTNTLPPPPPPSGPAPSTAAEPDRGRPCPYPPAGGRWRSGGG